MKSLLKIFTVAVLASVMAWPMIANATNVTFQVNMGVQMLLGNFDPATHQVVVRGTFNSWSGNAMTLADANNDSIYTNTFDIAEGDHEFKYVIVGGVTDVWEAIANNRTFTLGAEPLVLPVVYFSDVTSAANADVEVNFRVDMRVQALSGNFDPATDWVVVRGAHDSLGQWGGAVQLIEETGNPGVYSRWIQFPNMPINVGVEYKYVILANADPNQASWESTPNRSFTPTGSEPDILPPPSGNGFGEIQPSLVFFSDIDFSDIIAHDLTVYFQVDARPLFYRLAAEGFIWDVQTGDTIYTIESLQEAGFFNNWPWGNFPPEDYMNDNGTNGDLTANDTVYTGRHLFPQGSARTLIYKYGANQLDAEAGFARNHERDLDDSGNEYRMPIDCWGSPDTLFDGYPCLLSGVGDENPAQPAAFSLEQNYPNPFNPSTVITFVLPRTDIVTLKVFDVLGREVRVEKLGLMDAGRHTVSFNGSTFASGIYFYTLESTHFNATRKMLLMK